MCKVLYVFVLIGVLLVSCTPKEEQITSEKGISLRFSKDTIMFDTLLSSVGSVTKRVLVYNDADKAVLTNVSLGKLSTSQYHIWVNGVEDYQHDDVLLFGKDSMLILVEVTIDPMNENLPYLVKDSITFTTNGKKQNIKLNAFGQDANFLKDSVLACNTTWTAGKPYVIVDSVTVPTGCNLTIEQGVKVLFDYKAKLKIEGNLTVNGTTSDKVVFTNANDLGLEQKKALGYWSGMEFSATSTGNTIDWTEIKNAERGIYFGAGHTVDSTFELQLNHVLIANMSKAGIEVYGIDLNIINSAITNCSNFLVGGFGGGNYNMIHSSLANYSYDFFRAGPSLQFNANDDDEGVNVTNTLKIGIVNSVIWGNRQEELEVTGESQLYTSHSLFKTTMNLSGTGNIYNVDPEFVQPKENRLLLDTMSVAIDTAEVSVYTTDLMGNTRDAKPDMGAYEFIP